MDPFSYLSVLISIVLGLGLTVLLGGFASLVRARRRARQYWPLTAQMVFLFLLHIQVWWALFGLREVRHWDFASFLIVLSLPVALNLAASLVVPEIAPSGEVDLKEHYFREAPWFFGTLIATLVLSLAKNLALTGALQSGADLAGHLCLFIVAVAGFVSRKDWVHKTIAPIGLAVFAAYIGLLFMSLPN